MRVVVVVAMQFLFCGCLWSRDAALEPLEMREIPVYVADYHFDPMPGCQVIASVGEKIVSSEQTDTNGIALLSIVDDGLLTVECRPLSDLILHHTVRVLASDDSVSIRFRLTTYIPSPTFDVTVELDVPQGAYGGYVGSGVGCLEPDPMNRSPVVLEIDSLRCVRQHDGRFSVWGVFWGASSTVFSGAVRDLELGTTSASLVLTTDHGLDVGVSVLGEPDYWNSDAWPLWKGDSIGPDGQDLPNGVRIWNADRADSLGLHVGWRIGDRNFSATKFLPVGPAELVVDPAIHPQSLTSAFGIGPAPGGATAGWTAAGEGMADVASAVTGWRDVASRLHVWLIEVPPETGNVEIRLPLELDESPTTVGIGLTLAYRERDYVDGYPSARYLPIRPQFREIRSSSTVSFPPGSQAFIFPPD